MKLTRILAGLFLLIPTISNAYWQCGAIITPDSCGNYPSFSGTGSTELEAMYQAAHDVINTIDGPHNACHTSWNTEFYDVVPYNNGVTYQIRLHYRPLSGGSWTESYRNPTFSCQEIADPCPPNGTQEGFYDADTSGLNAFSPYCKAYNGAECSIRTAIRVEGNTNTRTLISAQYTGDTCSNVNFAPQEGSRTGTNDDSSGNPTEPTSTTTSDDGGDTTTTTNPDGSTTTRNQDGSTSTTSSDGTTTTTTNADGTETETTYTDPDTGDTSTTTTTENPDGSTTTENPDGSVTTTTPDGNTYTQDEDGNHIPNPDDPLTAGTGLEDCTNWIQNSAGSSFICADDSYDDGGNCTDDPSTTLDECESDDTSPDNGTYTTTYTGCDSAPQCSEEDDWKCVQTRLTWENRCLYQWESGGAPEGGGILDTTTADDPDNFIQEMDMSEIGIDGTGFINTSSPDQFYVLDLDTFGTYSIDLGPLWDLLAIAGYLLHAFGWFHAARIIGAF